MVNVEKEDLYALSPKADQLSEITDVKRNQQRGIGGEKHLRQEEHRNLRPQVRTSPLHLGTSKMFMWVKLVHKYEYVGETLERQARTTAGTALCMGRKAKEQDFPSIISSYFL